MKLTLKTQPHEYNPAPANQPHSKNSKKIIIDRLYSKKIHNKSSYNPEDMMGTAACHVQNKGELGERKEVDAKGYNNIVSQESLLLSSFKKQSYQIKSDSNQEVTQPSSNVYDSKQKVQFLNNFNLIKKKDSQKIVSFNSSPTGQVQDCFSKIFTDLKIRYKPVTLPDGQKRIQRSLLTQLYALQNKQNTKEPTNLIETAQFGVMKLQKRKSFDKANAIDINKQVSKDKQKNGNLKIELQPFGNKLDCIKQPFPQDLNTQTQPAELYKNFYASKNNIDILNRAQASRRSKTEVSLIYRDHEKIQNKNDGRENGHIRAYSHNHRLLRAAPRSNTERACSYGREVGVIRRQDSKTNLFANHAVIKNNSMPVQPYNYPTKQHQTSREKLQQIRQQLHHIYNTRHALNNQPIKNTNSRSHCYLPHNSSNSSITSGIYVNQVQNRSRNQVKNGLAKVGGFMEKGCQNRAPNYGHNYNHRLLLERSRNVGLRQ